MHLEMSRPKETKADVRAKIETCAKRLTIPAQTLLRQSEMARALARSSRG